MTYNFSDLILEKSTYSFIGLECSCQTEDVKFTVCRKTINYSSTFSITNSLHRIIKGINRMM